METFATELSEAVDDLDGRNPCFNPPSPTGDKYATKGIKGDAAQGTQIEGDNEAELKMSSMSVRLDRLSHFRIHTDAIYLISSERPGCGGKAEVVKATLKQADGSDEQQVAVKKLWYYDDINGRKFGNEFVHELDMMARLSHKNIVQLIGFVEDLEVGKAWIVLSWEPNGNVREFLATGEWEIPERISLAYIEYLHTRQPPVCHGDLKSLNILVSAEYRAIITDLGSARILKETEDDGGNWGGVAIGQATDLQADLTQITIATSSNHLTLTGPAWSLRWAAPEVALGERQSLASDIWAAGWICWEVMTDKVPFHELNSEGAIVLKVVQGHVPAPHVAQCNKEIQWMPSVAHVHRSRGTFKEAISLFQQSLLIATSTGDEMTRAEALCGLGTVYCAISKCSEAEQYYTQAQDVATRIGDQFGQARAFSGIGRMYHHQSNLTQAEASYTQARNLFSGLGSVHGQAVVSRTLGNIFSERSQYVEAEELYNQAIDIFARIGDHLNHADTLVRLGALFMNQSEYAKAEEFFNRSSEKYCRVGSDLGQANVKRALGHLYRVQGLNIKAAPRFAEARSLYAVIGDSRREKDCTVWLDVVSKEADPSTASLSDQGNDDVPSSTHQQ
ncbi:hypothetical protein FRC01_003402 [Tulasnella sp. 417]|nr:hypothetical protein FRC01_003402 [Tulasnella sp. 417]